jgi:diguanylate cyclase (GGDEF)-like protein
LIDRQRSPLTAFVLFTTISCMDPVRLKNPSTGVYIREFMDELLSREIARASRHDRSLCLAMVALDKPEELFQKYGSKIFDQVLAHMASKMQLALRQSDSAISQWSPNHFLICLMECDMRGAVGVIERIKSRVSAEPLHILVHQIPVSISAGVASLRPGIKSETLIQEAEHALNTARQKGVNQISQVVF